MKITCWIMPLIVCPHCKVMTPTYMVEHSYVGDTGVQHHEFYVECAKCGHTSEPAKTPNDAECNWNSQSDV